MSAVSLQSSSSQSAISFESNDLQTQREKIKQFVKDNYKTVISNVDHLDEAEVVCFGESHFNESHRKINGQLIDTLYVDEGILLLEKSRMEKDEGSNRRPVSDPLDQAKFVTKPIPIQGWDIQDDTNRIEELKEFVRACMIYEGPKTTHFVDLAKAIKWKEDLENVQSSTCSRIATIFKFCCTVGCTALFVKSCTPCLKKYYKYIATQGLQKIVNEVPIRNQGMEEATQEALETRKKVFIIGGSNHFNIVEHGAEGIDYGPSNEAVRKTMEFLATKKYAILIPKSEGDY